MSYRLTLAPGEDPGAKAADIALEQTAEMPAACVPPDVAPGVVGRVQELDRSDGAWHAVIAYNPALVAGDAAQLFNLVFGNISLKQGILVTGVDLPADVLGALGGPAFGIPGMRELCGVRRRPILCTVTKPVGLRSEQLAELAYRFARGGADIVKDDHSLADQATARFRERVERCVAAVERANGETGSRCLFFPNVTGDAGGLAQRLEFARRAGCRGVMLSPLLSGVDAARLAGRDYGLAVLAHPTLTGGLFGRDHGVAPEILLGRLFRAAGADCVIYANVGGRFPWTEETCHAINHRLREPLDGVRPAFPAPAGGVDAARVPHWIERYGADTMIIIGGSLYERGDLEAATRGLREAMERSAG